MGARFESHFVYIIDKNNTPHFVQNYYGADYGDSYRSDIYLANKSYCLLDLYLTDEVEEEGEFLPRVKEKEWREFLSAGPSENAATILAEAGLEEIPVSKLVFVRIQSGSRSILEYSGFVSSGDGTQDFDEAFWQQALSYARAKTGSPAEQEGLIIQWIVEQIQKGNYPTK